MASTPTQKKRRCVRKALAGQCLDCRNTAEPGKCRCAECLRKDRVQSKAYRDRHREQGLCKDCPRPAAPGYSRCVFCLDDRREAERNKRRRKAGAVG